MRPKILNWRDFEIIKGAGLVLRPTTLQPISPIFKIQNFLWACWFFCKNLSNFIYPVWKLHNPYCHWKDKIISFRYLLTFRIYLLKISTRIYPFWKKVSTKLYQPNFYLCSIRKKLSTKNGVATKFWANCYFCSIKTNKLSTINGVATNCL